MKFNRRLRWLLGGMVVVAALLIRDRLSETMTTPPPPQAAAVRESLRPNQRAPKMTVDILPISDRSVYANAEGDAFPLAPRAIPVQRMDVAVLPPPKAPTLPFTFIGKEFEAGAWRVFLAQQDSVLVVTDEQVFLEKYKVLKIRPPVMEILYMPLNETQTIAIGAPHND
jgi:hypothetical protein